MNIASGTTGLGITSTYLGYLSGGSYTFGNANDTGMLTVEAYGGWNAPVTFLTKSTGSISVIGGPDGHRERRVHLHRRAGDAHRQPDHGGRQRTFNPAVTLGQDDTSPRVAAR